jgi:hypothetical protein
MAKILFKGTPWYIHAAMIVSVALVVGSFFVPPMAVIDASVLAAIGEIMGGATLMNFVVNIPTYLEAGVKAKISHGNTAITVAADEVEDSEL